MLPRRTLAWQLRAGYRPGHVALAVPDWAVLDRWQPAMKLSAEQARARLAANVHGVMCTVHPERGPDPVPAVYAVHDDGYVGVPIDRIKPKASTRLQREDNLLADPRSALLVEHWDTDDWSRLWWVRADLEHVEDPPAALTDELAALLASTVPQYADQPFHRVVVCRIVAVTGWAASES